MKLLILQISVALLMIMKQLQIYKFSDSKRLMIDWLIFM